MNLQRFGSLQSQNTTTPIEHVLTNTTVVIGRDKLSDIHIQV